MRQWGQVDASEAGRARQDERIRQRSVPHCLIASLPNRNRLCLPCRRAQPIQSFDDVTHEIARALATAPVALCLDEVMGGLNPSEIHEAMTLIRTIRDSGVTVLMIEHHVHAVVGVSDRILVLNFGRAIAQGTPSAVMKSAEVVKAYLGEEVVESA